MCKKICARKNDAFYLSFSPSPFSSCLVFALTYFLVFCLPHVSVVALLSLAERPFHLSTYSSLDLLPFVPVLHFVFVFICLSVIAAVSWS